MRPAVSIALICADSLARANLGYTFWQRQTAITFY
jgi:hypothetical protein